MPPQFIGFWASGRGTFQGTELLNPREVFGGSKPTKDSSFWAVARPQQSSPLFPTPLASQASLAGPPLVDSQGRLVSLELCSVYRNPAISLQEETVLPSKNAEHIGSDASRKLFAAVNAMEMALAFHSAANTVFGSQPTVTAAVFCHANLTSPILSSPWSPSRDKQ